MDGTQEVVTEDAEAVDEKTVAGVNGGGEEVVDNNEAQERDYEAEARAGGWKPAEELADPAKFVDAKTFVERGEKYLPIVKERLSKTERDLAKAKDELASFKRTIKEASAYYSKAEERAYTRALADLKARHAEAVEAGDVKAGEAILEEFRGLEKPAPVAEEKPELDTAAERKKISEWIERTEWYGPDAARTKYADDVLVPILGPAQEYEGGTDAWLAEIERRVDRKFAEPKPNPTNGGGNRSNGGPRGSKTFSDLPSEAKAQCERFVKQIPGFTKEQYVKDYDWSAS